MTLGLPVATIFAFLLVLARVSGLVMFLPVPGFRNAPDMVRVILAVTISFALFPVWPELPNELPPISTLVIWAFAEASFGLAAGLAVAFLTEGFQLGAQVLGLQAGFGYASTIDPNSQADSAILQVVTSLMTGLLFFSTGLDHDLIRILAASFHNAPATGMDGAMQQSILKLGAAMFSTALRVALPVTALLLLIDFALALLGRIQQQLQLLTLAFPAKMLAALAILAALTPVIARLFIASGHRTIDALWHVAGR